MGLEEQTSLVELVTITRAQKAVYNIRVAEDHTYFVGCESWGFEVWVHNDYSVQKADDGTFQIIDDSGNVVRSGFKSPDEAEDIVKGLNAPKGLDVASQAAKGFNNLECKECVAAVVKEMKAKGLSGEIIDLSTDVNRPFIYSDRLGGVISQNGTHQAVRIGDTVFDNLNPNGIPYGEWLKDLHSVQGLDIKVTPF